MGFALEQVLSKIVAMLVIFNCNFVTFALTLYVKLN
jgi:hypothetical protein